VQSRRAGSASQVNTHSGTHFGSSNGAALLPSPHAVPACLPSTVFFDPPGRCGAEPAFPTINAMHIGPQWLIPLPSMDSADARRMRTRRVK
jgi:hypothetical protein